MCEIMERWENELREEGRKEGREEVKKEGRKMVVRIFKKFGKTQAETAAYLKEEFKMSDKEACEAIDNYW